MNYTALILAAGKGTRTGLSFNKVLYPWQGKPLLQASIDRFAADPDCAQIVLVCAQHEMEEFQARFSHPRLTFAPGGETRQDSVFSGLQQASEPYVLVHDGARPFVSCELIERIKSALETHPAVIPGLPVVDTIKQVDENGFCINTPVRSSLRAVQTPQGFDAKLLKDCLGKAVNEAFLATDDAMAVEQYGGVSVLCVDGDPANVKITGPQDLERLA